MAGIMFSPGCCCEEEEPPECEAWSLDVTVRDCATNALLSGVLVTVKDGGGSTVGTCTTGGAGTCSVTLPAGGAYTAVFSKSGLQTLERHFTAACGANALSHKMGGIITIGVEGCGCALPGVTATLTQTAGAGSYSEWIVTDAFGAGKLAYPATVGASYSLTYTAPNYQTEVFSWGPVGAGGCLFNLSGEVLQTEPGYFCYGGNPPYCRDPIPPTLTLTIASGGDAGTHTLTYEGTPSPHTWSVCLTGTGSPRKYLYSLSLEGCHAPGGFFKYQELNAGANCSGSIIGTTNPSSSSGTGACPVAMTFTIGSGLHTVSE